ncbi:Aldo/keto reductase [Hymenopellis radicata]|nr:Aldo/keto reductase [Hymenopellis radicata]
MSSFPLNDGNTIPWVAFGTGSALFHQDASSAISLAIDNGLTHLDGAQMYENEETLGAGMKASGKPRSDLYLTTKFHHLEPGQSIRDILVDALRKYDTGYVDLFLIHDPTPANARGELKAYWKQMEDIKREGLAKSIGVSNFRVPDLEDILETAAILPAVNQIELHPYVYAAAKPIYDFCTAKGIQVASYGTLAPVLRVPDGPVTEVLTTIASRLEEDAGKHVSTGQVLIKWLLQKNVLFVTTTSKAERIAEILSTPRLPDLTKLHKRIYMGHIFGEKTQY